MSTTISPRLPTRLSAVRGRPLRALLVAVAASLLASCHDDGGPCCISYVPYTPVEVTKGLVAGDFNNSGHTSIITTSTVIYFPGVNAGNLKGYYSVDSGTAFTYPILTPDGDDPIYLASADLNGDGLPDLVSASFADGTLTVFLNTTTTLGGPSFATPVVLTSPGASQVAIGDLNGDGMPDLVSADFNVSLFIQTAPGKFAAPIALYTGGANWVAVGDLNGDGAPDVALTDAVGVKVLFHTGAASSTTFAAPLSVFTQTPNFDVQGANVIAIADVNGDGFQDLIITDPGPTGGAAPTVNVLLQDATHPGTFLPPVAYPMPAQNLALSIVVTDLNNDGHPDIVVGGSSAVTVLLQDAAHPGSFLAAAAYPAQHVSEVAVADVNGDGLPDLIVNVGPYQSPLNGVITNSPGALLQSATAPGTFGPLQPIGTILAP
jgi:FG-GAP-like repeat/FG-GAP repeat